MTFAPFQKSFSTIAIRGDANQPHVLALDRFVWQRAAKPNGGNGGSDGFDRRNRAAVNHRGDCRLMSGGLSSFSQGSHIGESGRRRREAADRAS